MDLRGHQNVVIFDRDYPKEKQVEGIAVSHAVVYGRCEKCGFLKICATNDKFQTACVCVVPAGKEADSGWVESQ